MNSQLLSVLVVERHAILRDALCAAIAREPGLAVAGQVADSLDTIRIARMLQPDVILLAIENPLFGRTVIHALRELLPGVCILVLTNHEMAAEERAALKDCAQAILPKTVSYTELIAALRAVLQQRPRQLPILPQEV